jgi:hypothetical protein
MLEDVTVPHIKELLAGRNRCPLRRIESLNNTSDIARIGEVTLIAKEKAS